MKVRLVPQVEVKYRAPLGGSVEFSAQQYGRRSAPFATAEVANAMPWLADRLVGWSAHRTLLEQWSALSATGGHVVPRTVAKPRHRPQLVKPALGCRYHGMESQQRRLSVALIKGSVR